MAQDLSVTIGNWHNWQIAFLKGRYVVKSAATMLVKFADAEARAGEKPKVAIDFSLVTQIDSTALSQILSFQKRLRKKGGRFAIIGPNEYIKDMFNLVCFDMAVPTYETREQFEQSETA